MYYENILRLLILYSINKQLGKFLQLHEQFTCYFNVEIIYKNYTMY